MTHLTQSTLAPGSLEDLLERAGAVPAHDHFPSVDELLARFAELERESPDLVSSRRIGTSRLGEPIRVYTVGHGRHQHLVVGGVHPNEPIGALTAIHLAETLIADPGLRAGCDASWHIVPCIDPDGGRLNEVWFAAPGDRNHYARWFYRPAPDLQVEWSFPFRYKDAYFDDMLPETQALARLIDETRPSLYVSLHNGEFGGVYYYLSRPEPALTEALHAIPAALGLPLDTGEPESPHLERYDTAIFGTGTNADVYDYLEGLGLDAATLVRGSSSGEYAGRYGTLGLVAELPFWSDPAADDDSPTEESYGDLVRRTAADLRETHRVLAEILDAASPHLSLPTPFLSGSRAFVPMLGQIADMDEARSDDPTTARPATVAERFGREDLVRCFRLRYGGMLLRALDVESASGCAPVEVRRLRDQLDDVYRGWQEQAAQGTPQAWAIPIERLVGVQYGAVLAAAFHLVGTETSSGPGAAG